MKLSLIPLISMHGAMLCFLKYDLLWASSGAVHNRSQCINCGNFSKFVWFSWMCARFTYCKSDKESCDKYPAVTFPVWICKHFPSLDNNNNLANIVRRLVLRIHYFKFLPCFVSIIHVNIFQTGLTLDWATGWI